MGDQRQLRDRPSWAERRHLVNEDADGLALGDERGGEALSRLVENLLDGVGGRRRGIHGFTACGSPGARVCRIAHDVGGAIIRYQ
jgi:hypothetical protein